MVHMPHDVQWITKGEVEKQISINYDIKHVAEREKNHKILCHNINPLNDGIFFLFHAAFAWYATQADTCISCWYWFNQMLFKCYCLSS